MYIFAYQQKRKQSPLLLIVSHCRNGTQSLRKQQHFQTRAALVSMINNNYCLAELKQFYKEKWSTFPPDVAQV